MWRRGLSPERTVQAGFAMALFCLGVIAVISFASTTRLSQDAERTRHSVEVIAALRQLLSTATDVETAQRGHVITRNESFLQPYDEARKRIGVEISSLHLLMETNPGQGHSVELLAQLLGERVNEAADNIGLLRRQGFAAAQAAIASGRGWLLQDRVRTAIAEMEATEQSLLAKRELATRQATRNSRTIIAAGGVPAFFFVALGALADPAGLCGQPPGGGRAARGQRTVGGARAGPDAGAGPQP